MSKDDELVLCVPSEVIFKEGRWQGLKRSNLDYYINLIRNNYQFRRRGDVETDPSWQQIIPYIVFSHQDKFFIYQYLPKAGEQRLVGNYIIGVGGHINDTDKKEKPFGTLQHGSGQVAQGRDVLEEGTMREWSEEVDFKGNILEKKLIGVLNDERRPVEQVHLGLVYNFVGDSSDISIRETEKMKGQMVALQDIADHIKGSTGWIEIVYKEYLSKLHAKA